MSIRKIAKGILEHYPNYTAKQLISRIKKFDVVSFDIFDTLVKRYILKPTDSFKIIAERYNKQYPAKCIDVEGFVRNRINKESKCRNQKTNGEITLNEIYTSLESEYGENSSAIKRTELEVEESICYANPVIDQVYQWCKANRKKIYIISDMYLPKETVLKILHDCGFSKYEKVYLSSEFNATKKSGELFRIISKREGIVYNNWVHIGDNAIGDYISPRKVGIHSIKIATYPDRTRLFRGKKIPKSDKKTYKDIKRYISGMISDEWPGYKRYGFEVLGPLLYSFCVWLNKNIEDNEINKVFFLSRDGYLIKKAYMQIYPKDEPKISYLYVSRKSLRLPQVYKANDLETVMNTFRPYAYIGYKDFSYGLGIEADKGKEEWINAGFKENETVLVKDFCGDERACTFYTNVKDNIIISAKTEREKVIAYLKQNDFNGKVAIVDIGWAGTLQRCLERIIIDSPTRAEIHGYYIGMTNDSNTDIKARGFIPASKKPYSLCVGALECAFPAAEGSTKDYVADSDGKIVPRLLEYEYKDNKDAVVHIEQIQDGVLEFIQQVKKAESLVTKMKPETAYVNLERFSKHPRLSDAKLLGDLEFHDGDVIPLAHPRPILAYIRKPELFKTEFNKSTWKIGFLKRCIKIPFPYYTLLEKIKGQL